MRNQRAKALSVSRPVFDMVRRGDLTGRVLASYHRACNLVTSGGEIIALVGPAIGNGPLNIVVEETSVLEQVKPGLPAVFSDGQLILGDSLVVLLDGAQLWRPEVNWGCLTSRRRSLGDNLAALCGWLSQNDEARVALHGLSNPRFEPGRGDPGRAKLNLLSLVLNGETEPGAHRDGTRSPHNLAFLTTAWAGIERLLQALQHGDQLDIGESAALLAGLGPGLTPAGDDYLAGLMAGLRLWPGPLENSGLSAEEVCQIILEATESKTTLLSRAFLHSARQGLFGEDWHKLLAELARGKAIGTERAARRILSSGATSGADALAGFLSPYLWHRSGDFSRAPRSHGD